MLCVNPFSMDRGENILGESEYQARRTKGIYSNSSALKLSPRYL